jgi:hypothetical protein
LPVKVHETFHSLKEHRCPLCILKMQFSITCNDQYILPLSQDKQLSLEVPSFCCYFPLPSSFTFYFIFHTLIILFLIFHPSTQLCISGQHNFPSYWFTSLSCSCPNPFSFHVILFCLILVLFAYIYSYMLHQYSSTDSPFWIHMIYWIS